MRASHLDAADLWLLQNDPQLSKTTPRALASRRVRQQHTQGGELLEDLAPEPSSPPLDVANPDVDRLVRLAPPAIRRLVALRAEFPGASQAELARMMSCSRQAVSKKRQRLLAYLEAMAALPLTHSSGSVMAAPYFMEPNGQLAWDFSECE